MQHFIIHYILSYMNVYITIVNIVVYIHWYSKSINVTVLVYTYHRWNFLLIWWCMYKQNPIIINFYSASLKLGWNLGLKQLVFEFQLLNEKNFLTQRI